MTEGCQLRRSKAYESASVLSHFETPCFPAFLRYPAFSWGVQRNSTRAVAGFLMGGLPLGRLGLSIVSILPVQIILDKPLGGLYSVRTLNTEADMKDQAQYLEEVQALGWDSIEQYEEAQRFYVAARNDAERMYAEYIKAN